MKIDKTQPFSVACGTEEELAMINERLVSCMGSSVNGRSKIHNTPEEFHSKYGN